MYVVERNIQKATVQTVSSQPGQAVFGEAKL